MLRELLHRFCSFFLRRWLCNKKAYSNKSIQASNIPADLLNSAQTLTVLWIH